MASANAVEPAGEPCTILPRADFKVIDAIAELLETRTRRQAVVDHAPDTSRKAASVLIASILLESGLDAGSDLVAAARHIVYATVLGIKSAQDGDAALDMALAIFAPENAESPIGVHRTMVDGMLPALTNKEMDDVVKNQYKAIMAERKKDRAQSPKIILAFDSTSERVAAAHPNGTLSYVKPGGQAAWVPGFKFPSCYDATNQLFVGCCYQDPSAEYNIATKSLPPVVEEMRDKVATVTETDSDVAVVEADREYFKGEIFAAASLGLLGPEGAPGPQPVSQSPQGTSSLPASKDEYLDHRREQLVEDIYSKMETHPGARVSHVELAPEKPTPRPPGPEKRDYHGTPLVAPECDAMREVEGLLGKPVPEGARRVAWNTFGFAAEGGHVTVLGLFEQGLSSLPVTIGNLSSLKELYLYNNELSSLPVTIGNLKLLLHLDLGDNQLSSLPETIGKLSSLQRLDLDRNPLSSLPETVKSALKEMKKRGCKIEGIKI